MTCCVWTGGARGLRRSVLRGAFPARARWRSADLCELRCRSAKAARFGSPSHSLRCARRRCLPPRAFGIAVCPTFRASTAGVQAARVQEPWTARGDLTILQNSVGAGARCGSMVCTSAAQYPSRIGAHSDSWKDAEVDDMTGTRMLSSSRAPDVLIVDDSDITRKVRMPARLRNFVVRGLVVPARAQHGRASISLRVACALFWKA